MGVTYTDSGADAVLAGLHFIKVNVPVQAERGYHRDRCTGDPYRPLFPADVLGLHGEANRTVDVVDDTPPEITLTTDPDAYTLPGHPYEEEGYTATDNYDGDLTDQITSEEKDGVVYYSVTDSSGNTATAQRAIVYDDRAAPVITLEGDDPLTVEKGAEVQDPGYTAIDDCDGDITDQVTVTQTEDAIDYTSTDAHGNTATAQRALVYVDTTPPVITLSGNSEMTIQSGDSFSDPGYTAQDAGDGDVTASVTTSGTVDPGTPGDYTITYSVTDSAGNTGHGPAACGM